MPENHNDLFVYNVIVFVHLVSEEPLCGCITNKSLLLLLLLYYIIYPQPVYMIPL